MPKVSASVLELASASISVSAQPGQQKRLFVPKCCQQHAALPAPLPCLHLAPWSPMGQQRHWDTSTPPLPPAALTC